MQPSRYLWRPRPPWLCWCCQKTPEETGKGGSGHNPGQLGCSRPWDQPRPLQQGLGTSPAATGHPGDPHSAGTGGEGRPTWLSTSPRPRVLSRLSSRRNLAPHNPKHCLLVTRGSQSPVPLADRGSSRGLPVPTSSAPEEVRSSCLAFSDKKSTHRPCCAPEAHWAPPEDQAPICYSSLTLLLAQARSRVLRFRVSPSFNGCPGAPSWKTQGHPDTQGPRTAGATQEKAGPLVPSTEGAYQPWSQPQKKCLLMTARAKYWPEGRAPGGAVGTRHRPQAEV